jgi:hypothetical protein
LLPKEALLLAVSTVLVGDELALVTLVKLKDADEYIWLLELDNVIERDVENIGGVFDEDDVVVIKRELVDVGLVVDCEEAIEVSVGD